MYDAFVFFPLLFSALNIEQTETTKNNNNKNNHNSNQMYLLLTKL